MWRSGAAVEHQVPPLPNPLAGRVTRPPCRPCPRAAAPACRRSAGEKAAVHRFVNEGKDIGELPFVQGHPKKLQHAQEYAEEVGDRRGCQPW